MRTIAFITPLGGTGQTSVVANVATALARDHHPCLAIDLCPQNSLGLHLGLPEPATEGWAPAVQAGQWWAEPAQGNSDGVGFLAHGALDADALDAQARRWLDHPGWLAGQLGELNLDERTLVLLDVPPWPQAAARQALACADLVVACVEAAPRSALLQAPLRALRAAQPAGQPLALVVTGLDPRRPSQRAALQTLREQWSEALAPYALHHDESMAQALARHGCVVTTHPQAQSAHDLQGIAQWLARQGSPRAPTP